MRLGTRRAGPALEAEARPLPLEFPPAPAGADFLLFLMRSSRDMSNALDIVGRWRSRDGRRRRRARVRVRVSKYRGEEGERKEDALGLSRVNQDRNLEVQT